MPQFKSSLEDNLKKCPPGYQVSNLIGFGASVPVTHFSNFGLAYFITDGQVCVY